MQYNFYLLFYCLLLSTPLMTRADNLRFALIPKETNNPFFIASGEGCKFAAKKLGNVECIFQGSANIDVRAQDKIISDLIDTGVDGIAVAISQSEFLASHSIKKAIEHQIPVITYDADFDPQTLKKYQHLRLSYIGSDDFELGKALGEQLTLYRPNGGVLAIQSGRPDSPNLNLRVMGVRSALSGKLYSTAPGERLNGDNGWTEISQPLYNFGQFDKALEDLKTVLNLYQDQKIDSFVAVGGWPQFIEGYRDIVEPYKLDIERKDIVVIIGDSAKLQRQYLQEHLAHANIGQNPFEMGKQAIFTLYKIVNKQKYEKQIMTPLTYCTQDNYRTCTGKN